MTRGRDYHTPLERLHQLYAFTVLPVLPVLPDLIATIVEEVLEPSSTSDGASEDRAENL